ncbi:Zinc-transporting ATPase [Paraliobacillus sp. PM-2]|nr:Zinc-transporting ATPase [Paraliobacillus sp. PM-2]
MLIYQFFETYLFIFSSLIYGISDAPALATAGTDVAMETADLVLMSNQLEKIPYSLALSRATVRNMKQNIYFAVAIVVGLLIGVMTKNVFLASGMLIHELSVLLVILNAIRVIRFGNKSLTAS